MKRTSYTSELLLRRSGELPPARQARLERALARDPQLRRVAGEMDALEHTWRKLQQADRLPDRRVRTRLRVEAAATTPWARFNPLRFPVGLCPPSLAMAAALLALLAGAYLMRQHGGAPASPPLVAWPLEALDTQFIQTLDDIDSRLAELQAMLANGDPATPYTEGDLLALELMHMEDS